MDRRQKQLTFEDYLSIFGGDDPKKLNIYKIKQMLSINGVGGLKKLSKKDLIEAVNSINLSTPTRSTVQTSSPSPILCHASRPTLEELKKDIEAMEWQECPIGSIRTINPATFGVAKPDKLSGSKESSVKRKRTKKDKQPKEKKSALALPSPKSNDNIEPAPPTKKKEECFSDNIEPAPPMKKKEKKEECFKTIRLPASRLNRADEFSWISTFSCNWQGAPNSRQYFKCEKWGEGCEAKRYVDKDPKDPSMITITYYLDEHNHNTTP